MRKTLLLILPALLLTLVACKPDSTYRGDTEVYAYFALEDSWGEKIDTVGIIDIDHQLHGDTIMLYVRPTLVPLPLRVDQDLTEYVLCFTDGRDTLHVAHTRQMIYLSLAGGMVYFHTIDSVWTTGNHDISSYISKNSVTTESTQNVLLTLEDRE